MGTKGHQHTGKLTSGDLAPLPGSSAGDSSSVQMGFSAPYSTTHSAGCMHVLLSSILKVQGQRVSPRQLCADKCLSRGSQETRQKAGWVATGESHKRWQGCRALSLAPNMVFQMLFLIQPSPLPPSDLMLEPSDASCKEKTGPHQPHWP